MTLRELRRMLGKAIGRKPYSKSYVHELLNGDEPITPRLERAARVLMLGAAAVGEDGLADPTPTSNQQTRVRHTREAQAND